ncbi:MAG: heparinase II/III family protein [Clostridia bacterium]|nr:heparinase II/III family protein [Clostridia bacterium]
MFEEFLNTDFLREYRESDKYESIRGAYLELYEKHNKELKTLSFSKIRRFSELGERYSYEKDWNEHYYKLHICAYMAIIYGGEYLGQLEDCIYDMLSIYTWALPAHVPDINEENYYELDLCSTALSSSLALIYHLLGDKIHPQLAKRIKTELKRRILEPFKNQVWHWEDRYNNWTSVCAGFTGITLMLVFPEEFDKLLPRFDLNMEKYYKGFPDDGVCLEGPGYWGYGFVSFLAYAYALREYTRGERDYFKLEKTKKIALFYQKTMLDEDVITSYGDAPMDVKTNAMLFYMLKNVYGNEFIMPTKKRHATPLDPLISILLYIKNYDPVYDFERLPEYECYMESAGWYIKRTKSYAIGGKGGTNGESHNHNDVGSFILSKNNRQVLIDIGVRPYTKDYFTEGRYDRFMETSSKSHNVPIIDGQYQGNIPETRSYTSFENGVFTIEYKELYDLPNLTKLVREICPSENSVTIKEYFEGATSFVDRLVSYEKPKIRDGVVDFGDVKILFDKEIATIKESTDYHTVTIDDNGKPEDTKIVYYTDLILKKGLNQFSFTIDCK